jgi:hypothetical protein
MEFVFAVALYFMRSEFLFIVIHPFIVKISLEQPKSRNRKVKEIGRAHV